MSALATSLNVTWRHFLPRARISVRIITAVVVTMMLVLLATGAFVYWRISFALNRQLDQDLRAYTENVTHSLKTDGALPADDPGEVSQTYTTSGRLIAKSDAGVRRLVDADALRGATTTPAHRDLGRFLPASEHAPYRILYQRLETSNGPVVLVTGISRSKHDEALRELLGQLALADLATVLAAAVVGWGATRAALGPVERYRRAAAAAGGNPAARLPIDPDRNDELTRLGTTLNTLLAEIEDGQRRERQFLADASHELRSPLALLAAEVEWARHRPRTPEQIDRVLDSIGDQTRRLAELADALLDLEEVTSESATSSRQAVSLAAVVQEAASHHRASADARGRTIEVDVVDTTITLEARWVELALSNLIGNALKYGSGTVTVSALVVHPTATLTVTDEGPGIPAELGYAAFERFARADAVRTTSGNGLGLAIVAAVAERHGGSVQLLPGGVALTLRDVV